MFAVTSFEEVDPAQSLPLVDCDMSKNLHAVIAALRNQQPTYKKLSVVREGDLRTLDVMHMMIEDKVHQPQPLPSFSEFIRQLQNILAKNKK